MKIIRVSLETLTVLDLKIHAFYVVLVLSGYWLNYTRRAEKQSNSTLIVGL